MLHKLYTSLQQHVLFCLAPMQQQTQGPQQHFRFEPLPNNVGNLGVSQGKLHEKVELKTEKLGNMLYARCICYIVDKKKQKYVYCTVPLVSLCSTCQREKV
jgi:hypothetical protein